MIKFKTLIYCILVISGLIFEGFANSDISAQNRFNRLQAGQPFVKCLETKNNLIDQIASDNNQTIIVENSGIVRQINNSDHLQNWHIELGNKLESIPYLYETNILLISYAKEIKNANQQTSIRQINSLTGITDWITSLNPSEQFLMIRDSNTENITLLSDKLNIRQIEPKNGKILWSIDLKGDLGKYTSGRDFLYILTTEDKLFIIRIKDGSILSETEFKSKNVSALSYINDSLFLGNIKGVLYKFSDNTKVEKLFRTGGEVSFIKSFGSELLVVSRDNFLYYYSTEKEKILWKKRLSGRVILEPVIYQDLIFTTSLVEPVIYIFNRIDGTLVNQINLGENYYIKKIAVNESGVNVLTTSGLLKFGVDCQD
ncbi:hypothetical protein BH20ACI4_BH20ACI4_00340 [soil metagenome]